MQVLPGPGSQLRVWAEEWTPQPRDASPEECAAARDDVHEVYRGLHSTLRRAVSGPAADPFWTAALGPEYIHYRSAGQQQAARSVLLAPPGSTAIVCLPTGQGKTETVLRLPCSDGRV